MRESTRAVFKKHGYRVDRAIHNIAYFKFYYLYVACVYRLFSFLARYFPWFKALSPVIRTSFDRYHAKVLSRNDAVALFKIDRDISITGEGNKRIIPYRYAHDIILSDPALVALMDCPCKLALGAPPETIHSCIAIGRPTALFWLEQCKKYHAEKIRPDEAIDIIERFRKDGYVTQAFFKVATGGSTGVICNCRKDSCVSLQATDFAKRFSPELSMQAASGYMVVKDDSKCSGCGKCVEICQFGTMRVRGDKILYDRESCMGCGLCVEHCPDGALLLARDPEKPFPLDLDAVISGSYSNDVRIKGNL